MKPEHDEALVEQRHITAALNAFGFEDQADLDEFGLSDDPDRVRELIPHFARFEQSIRTTDAARIAELEEVQETAAYLIDRLDAINCKECVRDLEEARGAYTRATLRSSPDAP